MLEHAEFLHELLFPNGDNRSGDRCELTEAKSRQEKESTGVRKLLETDPTVGGANHMALLGYN